MAMKTLEIKVQPKARRNEILVKDGRVIIKVTAPPERGKANEAAVALLADKLGVKKSDITILRGETSRNKLIGIKTGERFKKI